MTEHKGQQPGAKQNVLPAAAAWVVRMHSDQCTRDDELAFDRWLRKNPAHAEAYHAYLVLWQGTASLDDTARRILRHDPGHPKVDVRVWGKFPAKLAAAAAVAVVGTLILSLSILFRATVYETAHGEQRMVVLQDGSHVMLNTDSRLRVELRRTERRAVLEEGQAFFQVTKDAARPFRVFVGDDEVRAIGTAFEVRKDGATTRVILEEGVVALYRGKDGIALRSIPAAGSARLEPVAFLMPGQQAKLAATGSIAVDTVNVSRLEAWREGRVVFEDTSLADAAAEINRYGGQRIVLSDPHLASLKISGIFHTGRPEAFVEAITKAFRVHIASTNAHTVVLASDAGTTSNQN